MPELIFRKAEVGVDPEQSGEAVEMRDGPVEWEGISPYKQPDFKDEAGLLAAGDELTDFSAAIKAIGAGRRAAASIHQVMYGIEIKLDPDVVTPDSGIQNVYSVENVKAEPREIMPLCPGTDLEKCGDLEMGFSGDEAATEANRCLQCGLICYKQEPEKKILDEVPAVSAPAGS